VKQAEMVTNRNWQSITVIILTATLSTRLHRKITQVPNICESRLNKPLCKSVVPQQSFRGGASTSELLEDFCR